jgi:uncharacterized protein (DUF885 family)
MPVRLAILALLVVAGATIVSAAGSDEDARLKAFFDREWQWGLEQFPEGATSLGDNRYNDRLTDMSLDAIAERRRRGQAELAELKSFHRDALSAANRVNYDLFLHDVEIGIEGDRFPAEYLAIGPRSGIQIELPSLPELTPFRTSRDYEAYLSRLSAIPRLADQVLALLARGVETGWVPARIAVEKVPDQLRAAASGAPEKSPFFEPFAKFPEGIPAADRDRLARTARETISGKVQPAFAKVLAYFTGTYLAACRRDVGAWSLPDGEAFYRYAARLHTTTDLSPREIHEIGLREVARIHAAMEKVIAETKFQGSFADFLKELRTNPKFYYRDAADLVAGYRDIAKRIDGELPRLFATLPRNSYGLKVIPAAAQPAQTTAYYQQGAPDRSRAGFMMVNTYRLETRPRYEMEALTLHEAVPGHHLQISRAQELADLPDFRRNAYYDAFGEGWGLYAESLGGELGLYQDPYSRFGQLTYQMWRACRLVVDTGMHAFHWERQRAIDYMVENSAKSENDITVEVDRYISWPGQALAYKIGEMKIRELRDRAEKALGARFDVRRFHDAVLGEGSLPLDVLEKNIDAWIAGERAK